MWRSNVEKQELWRFSKSREKRGKKKGKSVFKSGMKTVKDWRGFRSGRRICLKWNGIKSLLKIGGRMSRYVFCPIFINEEDLEILV